MAFDPAQDPWGAALLVTAALSGLGLVLALVARGSSRSAAVGGWLMGLGLVGFLGSAVAGAVVRVESAVASTAPSQSDPEDSDEAASAAPTRSDAHDDEPSDESEAVTGTDDDESGASDGESDAADAPSSVAIARPGALPSDPVELRAAVRVILRDGKKVAEGKNSCTDPQQLADTWAKLAAIPDDTYPARANVIVKKLDACRRKLVWTTLYVVRHERVKERGDFVSVLDSRLQEAGKPAAISVHEKSNARLRVGSQSMSHEEFAAMLEGGLQKELEALGFEKVTFSDGSEAVTTGLDPVADQTVANQKLAPYGLLERFSR